MHRTVIEKYLHVLPASGDEWSVQDRVKWLQMADYIFERLYEGEDDIGIVIEADHVLARSSASTCLVQVGHPLPIKAYLYHIGTHYALLTDAESRAYASPHEPAAI